MRATSFHERHIGAPLETIGALIDTLASDDDRLWPHRRWPAMRLDRALGVAANGGHTFIRYDVTAYEPGRSVTFRFKGPRGLTGTHRFDTTEAGDGTLLSHTIEGKVALWFIPSWSMVVRPLHDALIEDAMDNAQREAVGPVADPAAWSWWVRTLRRVLGGRS